MDNNQQDFALKKVISEEPTDLGSAKKPKKPARGWSASGRRFRFRIKYLGIGLAIIVIIVLIFVAANLIKGWLSVSFSKDKVGLEITAPGEISSGEEIEFSVFYQNDNQLTLEDAKLVIDYPQDAYSLEGNELTQETLELNSILPKTKGVKNFKIRLAGEKGNVRTLAIKLNYQPENTSSRFENFTSFKMNITAALVGIYLAAPQKAISGEEISYNLDYINNSDQDFSDLKIELDYPLGFTFKTADPEPTEENNIWQLEQLKQDERGTIRISGILEGTEEENKTLKASISKAENDRFLKYSQTSSITQIASSPLLISLFLNKKEQEEGSPAGESISSGEKLNYKIEFKNNADVALSQLSLKAYFQGEMLDFKTLKLKERGFFDSLNNVIIWGAAGINSLALLPPGQSGEVGFSLSLKKDFSIENFDDKNFQISVRVEIETFNVPPQFNLEKLKIEKILSSKINTHVVLQAKGYYNETSSSIKNSGPIPPKANQTTTYTIHWQITNASNDLKDIEVTAVLPVGIEWQDAYIIPENTGLEYNGRTKEMVWKIDKLPAATGFLIPVYEAVFQIAITPSITQVGTTPVLSDESSLKGTDVFTKEMLESFSSAIPAYLPDDLTVDKRDGMVVE